MRKKYWYHALWLLPLVGIVVLIVWSETRPKPGESVADQGNQHLTSLTEQHVEYNTTPPTSGPHLNQKAPWGVSDARLSDELQVHNLEDGGVIVHYDPEKVDDTTKASLANIVNGYPDKVILEPYAGLETPIILTAWTKIDKLQAFDEKEITSFIAAYRGIDHHK